MYKKPRCKTRSVEILDDNTEKAFETIGMKDNFLNKTDISYML